MRFLTDSVQRRRRTAAILATAGILASTLTTSLAVRGSAADRPANATPARLTQAAANTLIAEITDRTWAPDAMHYDYGIRFDPAQNVVLVVTDAPERVLSPLRAAHPGQVVTHAGTITRDANRFDDIAPFFGAGAINDGKNGCTSGVTIVVDRERYLTTAAHCFPVDNEIFTQQRSVMEQRSVGFINRAIWPIDTALIWGSAYVLGRIWVGTDREDAAVMQIAGTGEPSVDLTDLCISGRSTFYHCGMEVTNAEFVACFDDEPKCNNDGFAYTGPRFAEDGDSGAPVFAVSSGKALIIGLHIGVTYDKVAKQAVMFGIPIDDVLTSFGAKLPAGR